MPRNLKQDRSLLKYGSNMWLILMGGFRSRPSFDKSTKYSARNTVAYTQRAVYSINSAHFIFRVFKETNFITAILQIIFVYNILFVFTFMNKQLKTMCENEIKLVADRAFNFGYFIWTAINLNELINFMLTFRPCTQRVPTWVKHLKSPW